jgi:hypothetical protein
LWSENLQSMCISNYCWRIFIYNSVQRLIVGPLKGWKSSNIWERR